MPFGEDLQPAVGNRSANAEYSAGDQVRQKFTGYQKDEETKLDFAEARMYENRHARFTAIDPLLASGKSANPQTFNRYIYVGNNPLLLVDRNGLIWGKSEDGRVRWFGKKLGTGFSEFRPDNWEYIGKNNKIIRLDPNSRKFTERDVPLTPGAVDNPIPSFLGGFRQSTYDSGTGFAKGLGNFGIGAINTVTDGATGGMWRSIAGYNNPFEIERFQFYSAAEARFGMGSEIGAMGASVVVGGVFTGKPTSLSIKPSSSVLAGFGSDAAIVENSANLAPKKGWFDAVVHGTRDGQNFVVDGKLTSPTEFYGMMLKDGYKPGTNIRLMSCYSGSCSNGAASQLSNLSGARVVAPNDYVFVPGQGSMFTPGRPVVGNGGRFRIFDPNQ